MRDRIADGRAVGTDLRALGGVRLIDETLGATQDGQAEAARGNAILERLDVEVAARAGGLLDDVGDLLFRESNLDGLVAALLGHRSLPSWRPNGRRALD